MNKSQIVQKMLLELQSSGMNMVVDTATVKDSLVISVSGDQGALFFRTAEGSVLVSTEIQAVRFEEVE